MGSRFTSTRRNSSPARLCRSTLWPNWGASVKYNFYKFIFKCDWKYFHPSSTAESLWLPQDLGFPPPRGVPHAGNRQVHVQPQPALHGVPEEWLPSWHEPGQPPKYQAQDQGGCRPGEHGPRFRCIHLEISLKFGKIILIIFIKGWWWCLPSLKHWETWGELDGW